MKQLSALLSISIGSIFIISLTIFFILNPQLIETIGDFTITFLNVEGFKGLFWTKYMNYLIVGILQIAFVVFLTLYVKNININILIPLVFIIPSTLWIALFFIPITEDVIDSQINQLFGFLIGSSIAILLNGISIGNKLEDKFLKYYSIIIGSIIIVLPLLHFMLFWLSLVIYNVCIVIIYLWYIGFGARVIKSPTPNSV